MSKAISFLLMVLLLFPFDGLNENECDKMGIEWIKVEGGTFRMGSDRNDSNGKPVHVVKLDGYYISRYEVTFEQYDAFCDATDRNKPEDVGWGRGKRPVINVCWSDAAAFCQWLSQKTGDNVHLPTEAQWEYAARGGDESRKHLYSGSNEADAVAWYAANSDKMSHPVGKKRPNELGVHDMSGNVYEWCRDWYDEEYYSHPSKQNPRGPSSGYLRVIRGGSWYDLSGFLACTHRNAFPPARAFWHIGFRLVKD